MTKAHLLAIDQGTTSTRAMVFEQHGSILSLQQRELPQIYPHPGWVEHAPIRIWKDCIETIRGAIKQSGVALNSIAGIGITNQRETTILWDRTTGEPIHNAIVWQDRRTAEHCRQLKAKGLEKMVVDKTGLLLDPYFSATKIAWLLDHVDGARDRAESGDLAFGTIDCYLLWRLTSGASHATDATNASRTMLFDIHTQSWDEDLTAHLGIPNSILPDVLDNTAEFGWTNPELLGRSIPIRSMIGDQQAAAVGQACFTPGMIKSTYGTGCFTLFNTGEIPVRSSNRLLTTIAYRMDNKPAYGLEGSIFIAGAAIQWLRDGLGIITDASETESLARSADPESNVYLVPAFTGLGAPYWDSRARASIFGLSRGTGRPEIARAALEAIGYQTRDLFEAMTEDVTTSPTTLRVDGGLTKNDWAMQFLSDILSIPVERPTITETTALGAAYLTGLQAGLYKDANEIAKKWQKGSTFQPSMTEEMRNTCYNGWQDSIRRTRAE